MENKRTIILIGAYLISSDKEVDAKEIRILENFHNGFSNNFEQINKIINNDIDRIDIEELIDDIKHYDKLELLEAFELFIELIYADGYYHKEEKVLLETIRERCQFDRAEFAILENRVSKEMPIYEEKPYVFKDDVKIGLNTLLAKIDPKNKPLYEKRKKDILLNGHEFVKKIKELADSSRSDLQLASNHLNDSSDRFHELIDNIDQRTKKIRTVDRNDEELEKFVNELTRSIKGNALRNLELNLKTLNKKKRSIDHFTIAFLGRTKAGKSTLHSIITKNNGEGIGHGKLRTTRVNQVYNWENLRIIDTPGIGAPGGAMDTDIAESILDECDLICYVITNDSIQETEFEFLSRIKKMNKPVIILLNVKQNITHPKRLEIFLKEPKRWLERQDHQSISGHINRIKEYMNKYYNNCYYEVVPVMLLAAFLAETEVDDTKKERLYEASNINAFLDGIKESVFQNGHLRKSQNIIDGSNFRINSINKELNAHLNTIIEISSRLQQDRERFRNFLRTNKGRYKNDLNALISGEFSKIKKLVRDFAINNSNLNRKELSIAFQSVMDRSNHLNDLEIKISKEFSSIQSEIEERVKEFAEGYRLMFERLNFDIKNSSTFDWRSTVKIITYIGMAIGSLFVGTAGAVAIVLKSSNIFDDIFNIMESKEERLKKAQKKIETSILKTIDEQEEEHKQTIQVKLNELIEIYDIRVQRNISDLVDQCELVRKDLENVVRNNSIVIDELNRGILLRALQITGQCAKEKDIIKLLSNDRERQKANRNPLIIKMSRDYDKSVLKASISQPIKKKDIETISNLLQTEAIITIG